MTPDRPWKPGGVYFVVNTDSVLWPPAWKYQQDAHDQEDGDLEDAEDGAEPGRGPDAEVAGGEDDEQAEY